jgi:hypothetical protein
MTFKQYDMLGLLRQGGWGAVADSLEQAIADRPDLVTDYELPTQPPPEPPPDPPPVHAGSVRNVLDFGAVADDGATDNRAAIQAAIDDVAAIGGGVVYLPSASDRFSIDGPLLVDSWNITIKGDGPSSVITTTSGNVLEVGNASQFVLSDIKLECIAAGATCVEIVAPVSVSRFSNVVFSARSATASCVRASGTLWELYDTLFVQCHYSAEEVPSQVPLISLVNDSGMGHCAQNTFLASRFTSLPGVTAPQFYLSNKQPDDYSFGNTLQGINFETPNAGAVHAESTHQLALRDLGVYDMTTATGNVFQIGKAPNGEYAQHTRFDGVFRTGGTLGPFYDIDVSDAGYTTLVSSGGVNNGKIHLHDTTAVAINPLANAAFDGTTNTTVI